MSHFDREGRFHLCDLSSCTTCTRQSVSGSHRNAREGKGRYDLLPPAAIARVAKVFEEGASRFGDRNWEKGQPLSWYLDSGLRHAFKFMAGLEDGEDHLARAAWNLLCALETQERARAGQLPSELLDLPPGGIRPGAAKMADPT